MRHQPDYQGGSLVNLMSSLVRAGGGASAYPPLTLLPPEDAAAQNIVLLVLDGCGYDFFLRQPRPSLLHDHLRGKITSVFPSTTASAITTFLTGVAPQQHAVTGWFMYLKEIGCVVTTLRFQARCNHASLLHDGLNPAHLFGQGQSVFRAMPRQAYAITPAEIVGTAYDTYMNPDPTKYPFIGLSAGLQQIAQVIAAASAPKFIYAYWPGIDDLCHEYGVNSPQVRAHYQEISRELEFLINSLRHTDTTLIITADHGLIDTAPERIIHMKHHPALREMLALPLCGEARAAFCYVRPGQTRQFETYIAQHFGDIGDLYKSEDLIHKGYFGLFDADSRLSARIGDYTLIMRKNYIIKDFLTGEEEKFLVAHHGGLSHAEMYVPLIVVKT